MGSLSAELPCRWCPALLPSLLFTAGCVSTLLPPATTYSFDCRCHSVSSELRSLPVSDAYGNFDVTAGLFSLYSELRVKNGRVEGYIKPRFKDMKVYDARQDKEKNLFHKLYEGLVGGVAKLLENQPREEVATRTELSGVLKNPQNSTGQTVINLVKNTFFKAFLPGFGKGLRPQS